MDEFLAGFYTWWAAQSATDFYTGIGGRLRTNIGLPDEVKPYCIMTQVDGFPEFFLDSNYDELYSMDNQFDIYSEANLEVLTLSKNAMAVLDNASFSISGWTILNFERTRNLLMPLDITTNIEQANFDFAIHRYFLTYDVIMQKDRV